ncbi:hypothetical protein C8R48DRAFT_733216 [Suillus tomentosus]|nr:hypothetical protein C8R48DRAFT_733216 [Suillus tomentosus]
MRAPPSFFGYQIFAALVSSSSACNSEDMMTLLLHYWPASSGVSFLDIVFSLFGNYCIVSWLCMVPCKQKSRSTFAMEMLSSSDQESASGLGQMPLELGDIRNIYISRGASY